MQNELHCFKSWTFPFKTSTVVIGDDSGAKQGTKPQGLWKEPPTTARLSPSTRSSAHPRTSCTSWTRSCCTSIATRTNRRRCTSNETRRHSIHHGIVHRREISSLSDSLLHWKILRVERTPQTLRRMWNLIPLTIRNRAPREKFQNKLSNTDHESETPRLRHNAEEVDHQIAGNERI